jgi:hypothetical protein
VLANPSIYVCIRVALLFAIVFSQPIIGFIKQGFDRFRLEREGADNRDRKIVVAARSHFTARVMEGFVIEIKIRADLQFQASDEKAWRRRVSKAEIVGKLRHLRSQPHNLDSPTTGLQ